MKTIGEEEVGVDVNCGTTVPYSGVGSYTTSGHSFFVFGWGFFNIIFFILQMQRGCNGFGWRIIKYIEIPLLGTFDLEPSH